MGWVGKYFRHWFQTVQRGRYLGMGLFSYTENKVQEPSGLESVGSLRKRKNRMREVECKAVKMETSTGDKLGVNFQLPVSLKS